ncbi:MAG: SRPBCC family protein [Acidobacteriota bacterium]|jgi:uncharacterized protein YndB with AHSA1/START domain
MFEFVVTQPIDRPPDAVWRLLVDVERWWLPSNPEHEDFEILSSDDAIALGTELRVRERIAGIPGEATGKIVELVPGRRITWDAEARYRWLGLTLRVDEGVTWSVRPRDGGSELSARVWARFPASLWARMFEWFFIHVLRGVEKDREHAATELEYLRAELEAS